MSDFYPDLPVFNIEYLKPYAVSDAKWGDHTIMKESNQPKTASDEYAVEAIIGHQQQKCGMERLVQWEGYGPQFNTWELTSFLRNVPIVLSEYKKAHGL